MVGSPSTASRVLPPAGEDEDQGALIYLPPLGEVARRVWRRDEGGGSACPDTALVHQALQAAGGAEDPVEFGAAGGGVAVAKGLERAGVVFLRLLGPVVAGKLDGELILAGGE